MKKFLEYLQRFLGIAGPFQEETRHLAIVEPHGMGRLGYQSPAVVGHSQAMLVAPLPHAYIAGIRPKKHTVGSLNAFIPHRLVLRALVSYFKEQRAPPPRAVSQHHYRGTGWLCGEGGSAVYRQKVHKVYASRCSGGTVFLNPVRCLGFKYLQEFQGKRPIFTKRSALLGPFHLVLVNALFDVGGEDFTICPPHLLRRADKPYHGRFSFTLPA
jgi:hypothetical protein